MKNTRRNFLKFAGLSAAALSLAPKAALASAYKGDLREHNAYPEVAKKTRHAGRWAMVIDTRKLNTAEAIKPLQDACHHEHNVPNIPTNQNIMWLFHKPYGNVFPEQMNNHQNEEIMTREYVLMCNHCSNPPCVRVCPTQATFKRPDGIVAMDYHRCIGCRFCMAGCPYGARSFNYMEPRLHLDKSTLNPTFPTRMRGVVEKCNFCVERLARGENPVCVDASGGALIFGDLDDPKSEVRKALRENFTIRRKPAVGTEPGVYYIL
ncbi:MAG: sulfate reduction electron transfer complex DsrMKJOP subunit DsrO [Desulfovibrio sp.]